MNESTAGKQIGNCSRWCGWAAALARSSGVVRRRQPLAFAWLRRRGTAVRFETHYRTLNSVFNPYHLHLSFPYSTAMNLTLVPAGRSQPGAPSATANAQPRDLIARLSRIEEHTSHTAEIRTSEFLRHFIERNRRIEERAATRELMVVRQPSSRAMDVSAERQHPPSAWPPEASSPPAWNRPPATPPAPDVDRIAENVMRLLDRRVGAWRERMGRM